MRILSTNLPVQPQEKKNPGDYPHAGKAGALGRLLSTAESVECAEKALSCPSLWSLRTLR